jgi:predicted nucleotidyltransferase
VIYPSRGKYLPSGGSIIRAAFSDTGIEILKLLTANLTKDFTILKIAEGTRKTNRLTYSTVRRLEKEHLITIQSKANLRLCKLSLKNPQTIALIESLRWNEFTRRHPDVGLLVSDIVSKSELPYFTLAIFGSYAKGTMTGKSDLDMLLVMPDRKLEVTIETAIKSARRLSNVPVHDVVVTCSEFVDMLSETKMNVAKETLEARYIAYGAEAFYTLLGRSL